MSLLADVDGAPGLDDGGVALVAPGELGFAAQLGHFALGHADEAAHSGTRPLRSLAL